MVFQVNEGNNLLVTTPCKAFGPETLRNAICSNSDCEAELKVVTEEVSNEYVSPTRLKERRSG